MKISPNTATLKAFYSEYPHSNHLDPSITRLALSHAQPSIHPSAHLHFWRHFKVNCRHQYASPYFFITNTVIFEEAQKVKIVRLLNFRRLSAQRVSGPLIILESTVSLGNNIYFLVFVIAVSLLPFCLSNFVPGQSLQK